MVTEYDSWYCEQEPSPGVMYTQAIIEHSLARRAKAGTVMMRYDYPDGTYEEYAPEVYDRYPYSDVQSVMIACSGGPIYGHGYGRCDITITYEPEEPLRECKVYLGDGEPPKRPALVIDELSGRAVVYTESGEYELNEKKPTWGLLKFMRRWAKF